jgi:hypothetical protein
MSILEDIKPLIKQIKSTTDPDEVIFYVVSFLDNDNNANELSNDDYISVAKNIIETNPDAQLAAEIARVLFHKKGLIDFATEIISDKSKYTSDDWSSEQFDTITKQLKGEMNPEIIMTYDELIGPDNPVRNGWDSIDWEAPQVQFFKGYYNGEYFEVGRVYKDPYEDDHGETYYNSNYFELESFAGEDENALSNIIESINMGTYEWNEEK